MYVGRNIQRAKWAEFPYQYIGGGGGEWLYEVIKHVQ
jgi:hypothetical protein